MIIPSIWENKKCSKPPTRIIVCFSAFIQQVVPSERSTAVSHLQLSRLRAIVAGTCSMAFEASQDVSNLPRGWKGLHAIHVDLSSPSETSQLMKSHWKGFPSTWRKSDIAQSKSNRSEIPRFWLFKLEQKQGISCLLDLENRPFLMGGDSVTIELPPPLVFPAALRPEPSAPAARRGRKGPLRLRCGLGGQQKHFPRDLQKWITPVVSWKNC